MRRGACDIADRLTYRTDVLCACLRVAACKCLTTSLARSPVSHNLFSRNLAHGVHMPAILSP